jgi:hypothetical protein
MGRIEPEFRPFSGGGASATAGRGRPVRQDRRRRSSRRRGACSSAWAPLRGQAPNHVQPPAAARRTRKTVERRRLLPGLLDLWRWGRKGGADLGQAPGTAAVGQEAEVAYPHEPLNIRRINEHDPIMEGAVGSEFREMGDVANKIALAVQPRAAEACSPPIARIFPARLPVPRRST